MALSIRIKIIEKNVTKTLQFDPSTTMFDVCKITRDKCSELPDMGQPKDYGIFLPGEQYGSGAWLEPGKTLDHYLLRNGDLLEYRRKMRPLKVRTLDGTNKKMLVDDSQNVTNLMVVICTKMGITNHDEYSLVRELQDENDAPNRPENYGTLTLRRKKEERERDAKMDQLRKKLKTDDEINWVDHTKTLREQGIEEDETLLLRRKFFFSDQNIDSHDPVQLNLLYVQARDAILDGTHPVTQEKACEFAGIQCQIQFGDHNPQKHRPGFLDSKDFLPGSYMKVKGIEKKVFAEHRKHTGLSEIDSKALYTKTARALDTYGVTFFLVKEKMPGKNKLVPRLLGVTKDSVLRLDERTKEILKTWPLTTVRRWAASPNTFTLDFGDYSDQYYSVQTPEGEQIAQLIAGYIDIILKKKQAKDHLGIEGDEGSTLVEEIVSPFHATTVQRQLPAKATPVVTDSVAMPAVVQPGPDGANHITERYLEKEQYSTEQRRMEITHQSQPSAKPVQMAPAMTATRKALTSGRQAIEKSEEYLRTPLNLPPLGSDPASTKWRATTLDTKRENVHTQIAAMNAATAHMVSISTDEHDSGAVGEAVSSISSGLPEVAKDARMIAALMEHPNQGDKLISATRTLCVAFSELLNTVEPGTKEPRQNLLSAAGRVGDASRAVLNTIEEGDETQDVLLGLAKNVANTSASLVVVAKKCAATIDEPPVKEEVISSAAQTALSASELVACAKVVAPTINDNKCRAELMGATRKVAQAVETVLETCNSSSADKNLKVDLQSAAREVSDSLTRLLDHIRPTARASIQGDLQEGAIDTIYLATDKIMTSSDSSEMVRQARILAQATAQLIQAIKGEAEKTPDSDQQKKLIVAAKLLAEATSRLVEAAKRCASNPNAPETQDQLRQAAQDLREATNMAAGGAVQRKALRRLESSAKNAASAAAQVIAAAQSASPHCTNATTKDAMSADCKAVADTIPNLVSAVKSSVQTSDETAQINLIEATDRFIKPTNSLVSTTKTASSFIGDQAASRHLAQCSQKLAIELVELRTAVDRMKADSRFVSITSRPQQQLESAADKIREAKEDIIACKKAAMRDELRPLPGDTPQNAIQRLTSSIRKVGTCTDQLVNSVAHSDEEGASVSAQGISSGLNELASAGRAVASITAQPMQVILATEEVLERSWTLIKRSSTLIISTESKEYRERELNPLAREVHDALDRVKDSIPGQREVDSAIHSITTASQNLESGKAVSAYNGFAGKNYGHLQSEMQELASQVAESAFQITNVASNPAKLGQESQVFSSKTVQLISTGHQLASLHDDVQAQDEIVLTLKNVAVVTSNFLVVGKAVSTNPEAPGLRNQLNAAARAVSESLNQLIDACSSAAPGQKECDNAVRRIQALKPLLDNPNEPLNSASYFDCQQAVVDRSKLLGDSMTGIANYAKEGKLDQFGNSVNSAADAICGLIESSAQAAYLLAAADSTSVAGKPGLVDIHAINESSQNIKSACQTLSNPKVSQQQVLNAVTTIAKHTSALCNACRSASERTTDSSTKRMFVQMAKEVASCTSVLVKEVKALDQSAAKRESCSQATNGLVKSINSLVQYASQPEFAAVPAKISTRGRTTQQPIISAGRSVIEGSCNMLQSAKSLAVNPKDPPTWQQLAQHSKHVSDAIKKLVTALREKAPGQKECEVGIQKLQDLLKNLNQASLSAVSQNLPQRRDNSLQGFVQNAETSLRIAEEHVDPICLAGKTQAENLGHQVTSLSTIIEALVSNIIGVSSNIIETKEQVNILERSRTVLESAVQFVCAAKESGGNPKATSLHPELDLSSQCFQEGLDDLKHSLERISSGAGGHVASITESLGASMVKLDQAVTFSGTEGYVDYQTRMVNSAKEIARLSQEMVFKSTTDPNQIPALSAEISHHYIQLANDARGAVSTTISPEIAVRIRCGVQELGRACIDLVRHGGAVQFSPGDAFAQRDLSDSNKVVSEKVSDILAALQAGSRGTQACINAASTVSGIIGDLDTTIMFATAGTLHAEGDETFADHRENILKTAKALVEDTKKLVTGAASTQEQLAVSAQNAVVTILQLAEAVKFGAASLGSNNPESQVMLINSVRDVAGSLYDLIHSTKSAAGKGTNDPSMMTLKDSAKIMVTNVTSLLKTVKAVEDEHTRGTRALEATIEAIGQEIRAFDSPEAPRGKPATAEELVRVTKPVTTATAKAVAAGSSCRQDDVIVAANMGRKAISDLLTVSKSAAYGVEGDIRERLVVAARQIAVFYRELLQVVLQAVEHPSSDSKSHLSQCSREIASAVTELVAVGQLMKVVQNQLSENPMLGQALRTKSHSLSQGGFEDPDDPTVIAENELLGAANSIDAAAKKLEKLRPRRSVKETDESLNFDEMILEAAKSIAAATSALVKAASAAQRELVDSGRLSRRAPTDSDEGQWSEGLVSAAQMVAAATHSLVEAANSLVQGHSTEEKLISASKQVAAATAQLLVACKVKASPDSDATRRLQAAGNAVKRATDNLVRAAQQALSQEEERQLVLNRRMVGGIAQVINARADVLRIERELEEARQRLAVIHKAKYQDKSGGLYPDDAEIDFDSSHDTSRLDTLLESSAEKVNNAASQFHMMRQQQPPAIPPLPQKYAPIPPAKPALSPKPTSIDRKLNNSSPLSNASTESSYSSSRKEPPPPPPSRSFQPSSYSSTNLPGRQEGDFYGRPRQQASSDHLYSPPSSTSTPAVKTFMKPSEFLGTPGPKPFAPSPVSTSTPARQQRPEPPSPSEKPTFGGGKVTKYSQDDAQSGSSFSQEYSSQWESGPIRNEQVIETVGPDGSVSLKRICQEQQTSSTSKVTQTRKMFQQKQQESAQEGNNNR